MLIHHSRPRIASIDIPESGSVDNLVFCKFALKEEAFILDIMEGEPSDPMHKVYRFPMD